MNISFVLVLKISQSEHYVLHIKCYDLMIWNMNT